MTYVFDISDTAPALSLNFRKEKKMEEKKIVNTSKEEINPQWTMGGNPGAIQAQEKRGQEQLVNSSQLPCDCSKEDKAKLESYGIVFGKPLENDPLFCDATLPEGWKKEGTNHDMWSSIVDDKGKKCASIFYKAAFYDRKAALYAEKD